MLWANAASIVYTNINNGKKGRVGVAFSEGQILALLSFPSLNLDCFAFGFFLFLFGNSDF